MNKGITFISRFFRIIKIRLNGKYKLLRVVRLKIIVSFIIEDIKKCDEKYSLNPQKFNDVMNKAQLNYFNSLSKK